MEKYNDLKIISEGRAVSYTHLDVYKRQIMVSAGSGAVPNIYFTGAVTDDAGVYGFSVYADNNASFTISEKGASDSWTAPDSINRLLVLNGGQFSLMGSAAGVLEEGVWNDVRLTLDYKNHLASVYINGQFTRCV